MRGVATGLTVAGGITLAIAAVGLLPMIQETRAVRAADARFELERLEGRGVASHGVAGGGREGAGPERVRYVCVGTPVVLGDRAPERPSVRDPNARVVTVQVGDTVFSTRPLRIHTDRSGPNRYWNRVVPFRWTARATGAVECGVVYRLPADTAAIARARASRETSFVDAIRGVRPAWQHGLRFRTVTWQPGEDPEPGVEDFGYADWRGDPYGVYLANLLGGPVGLRNQSLSYWPSLIIPIVYPLGAALLGLVLLVAGLIGGLRARRATG